MKGKYLITTDNWFYGPDGKEYRAVWGQVEVLLDSFLGISTNRNSTNWFIRVGSDANHVIIAGCQIHYAIKSEIKPNTDIVKAWNSNDKDGINIYDRPNVIYIAE
jgi:hypothetical protein